MKYKTVTVVMTDTVLSVGEEAIIFRKLEKIITSKWIKSVTLIVSGKWEHFDAPYFIGKEGEAVAEFFGIPSEKTFLLDELLEALESPEAEETLDKFFR